MPIDLQLSRILRLLRILDFPQKSYKAIHVAGTNGKGSVCAYLSHILTQNQISNGRFTSPHLITRNDSIQINNVPLDFQKFLGIEQHVLSKDKEFGVGCTEFEILTCIAMEAFKMAKVKVAIFEVGLGGRFDSTNILEEEDVLCCGITKIGMDHEGLLGSTLKEIAYQKAGIMKKNVPTVIDGSNDIDVLAVAKQEAHDAGCQLLVASDHEDQRFGSLGSLKDYHSSLLGSYQSMNLSVALTISTIIQKSFPISKENTQKGISKTVWPGRLQYLSLHLEKGKTLPVLLDGAHNTQAAIELGKFLDAEYRVDREPLCFVIGVTNGKSIDQLFDGLIHENDTVILTQFKDDIDGMPWIKPCNPNELAQQARKLTRKVIVEADLEESLKVAYETNSREAEKVVVCGSLYLVADILRINSSNQDT
ncbi:hypothetical protein CANARDRAFT_27039 [[Candida] arabinofermentans NRRL YB-2248]|uniref:Dihydrofolate synthetase n=1 Tax=[Candida] arabinofermentans NRRL YB-2248 TaxID=983967 RepID=A0A1E4T4G0_9ASCO|nr:hypothetical protein CANARDRAFT_27039 [[Candida] arabinofermentans NRRL YB-2248]